MKSLRSLLSFLLAVILLLQCVPSLADENLIRQYVARCYETLLGRSPDDNGLNDWSALLSSGQKSGSEIVLGFCDSQEFKSRSLGNEDLVEVLYLAMLGRPSDADGKNAWVSSLNAGASYRDIISGFCGSGEFKDLCARYGIIPGSISSGSGPAVNIGKIRAFVSRCYNIILGREPDAGGLEDWTRLLASGEKTAAEIIDGFYGSAEFTSKNLGFEDVVEILYKTMLDRASDPDGKASWVNQMYAGCTYRHIINGFCGSSEFNNLCKQYGIKPGSVQADPIGPAGRTVNVEKIKSFVTRCYKVILGRDPDTQGLSDWTVLLANGSKTASEIIAGFCGSNELQSKNLKNAELVEILYKAMLNRSSDPNGKAHWKALLDSGYSFLFIINGFCGSAEFKGLCDSYGIEPGSVNAGSLLTGWQTIGGNKYYYSDKGLRTTGYKMINSKWYYFDKNGVMQIGWCDIDGKQHYFSADGVMATDWLMLNNTWYYFDKDGAFIKTGPLVGAYTGVNLTDMKTKNNDFVAWISINGTNVNYPIVQSDNLEYYLDYNFDGVKSKDGTLFSLGKCDWRTPSKNIVVYGHHVEASGDRMFKALLKYKTVDYYREHPTINLDSMYHNGKYRIFAVFNMFEGDLDPSKTRFASDTEFNSFIATVKSMSLYDTGVNVNSSDTIISLVTCDRYFRIGGGRLIVMAVKEN